MPMNMSFHIDCIEMVYFLAIYEHSNVNLNPNLKKMFFHIHHIRMAVHQYEFSEMVNGLSSAFLLCAILQCFMFDLPRAPVDDGVHETFFHKMGIYDSIHGYG